MEMFTVLMEFHVTPSGGDLGVVEMSSLQGRKTANVAQSLLTFISLGIFHTFGAVHQDLDNVSIKMMDLQSVPMPQ